MPPFFRRNLKTRLGGRTYECYNPHTKAVLPPTPEEVEDEGGLATSFRRAMMIDPGIVNLGIYCEIIWSNGKSQFQGVDLMEPLKSETNEYSKIIEAGTRIFEELEEVLLKCHYIVIESQMLINMKALSFAQHFISTCCARLRDRGYCPLIIEINPEMKTKMLSCPAEVKTKYQRKMWCIEKAQEIMKDRGEEKLAEEIFRRRSKKGEGRAKKDDIGDGVCMARVWWKFAADREELKNFLE